MEKRTVNFFSEGARLEGDLMLPPDLKPGERRPAIVLCHGFTGVRSFFLEDYAKVFVSAGFVALIFDYRGWGGVGAQGGRGDAGGAESRRKVGNRGENDGIQAAGSGRAGCAACVVADRGTRRQCLSDRGLP